MGKLVLYLVVALSAAIALTLLDDTSRSFDIALGILVGFIIPLVDNIIANSTKLRILWYSIRYSHTRVRISVSYLFKIKVSGKYFLVRGHRWPQFQPVGGVYKITPSAAPILESIEAVDDDLVELDKLSEHDLRIHIPGKHIYTFYRWFDSGRDRETSPWREFYEELIETEILPQEKFPHVYHRYVRRAVRPMRFSRIAQSHELLIADIYELLPTPEQQAIFESIKTHQSEAFHFASSDEIRRRGARPGANQTITIGEPAEWIL